MVDSGNRVSDVARIALDVHPLVVGSPRALEAFCHWWCVIELPNRGVLKPMVASGLARQHVWRPLRQHFPAHHHSLWQSALILGAAWATDMQDGPLLLRTGACDEWFVDDRQVFVHPALFD